MSYNFKRKVDRAQMKAMIKQFKKEAKLSGRQFMSTITDGKGKGARVRGLKDQFSRMLAVALQTLQEKEKGEMTNGVSEEVSN